MSAPNCTCKPLWTHLEYCWRLENFWELRALASIEALGDEGGDVVWSNQFGDKRRGLWRLKLYPYGDSSEGGKGHVSLFLSLQTAAMHVPKSYAIFGCYVLDAQGGKISGSGRSFTRQKFTGNNIFYRIASFYIPETSSSWGWSQFIKVEEQILMKMLVNDCLTVRCEIDVFVGIKTSPGIELDKGEDFNAQMLNFLKNKDNHDTYVYLGDGRSTVNSCVLASRSELLKKLLQEYRKKDINDQSTTATPSKETEKASAENKIPVLVNAGIVDPVILEDRLQTSVDDSVDYLPVDDDANATYTKLLVLPDVSTAAFAQIVEHSLYDQCTVVSDSASSLTELLEVYRVSSVYGLKSLETDCIGALILRMVSKEHSWLILSVAKERKNQLLISECHKFLEQASETLQGTELIQLLLPNRAILQQKD